MFDSQNSCYKENVSECMCQKHDWYPGNPYIDERMENHALTEGFKYSREKSSIQSLPHLIWTCRRVPTYSRVHRLYIYGICCVLLSSPFVSLALNERTLRVVYHCMYVRMCMSMCVHMCACMRGNRGTVACCTCLRWLPRRYERIMGHISMEEKVPHIGDP